MGVVSLVVDRLESELTAIKTTIRRWSTEFDRAPVGWIIGIVLILIVGRMLLFPNDVVADLNKFTDYLANL